VKHSKNEKAAKISFSFHFFSLIEKEASFPEAPICLVLAALYPKLNLP
jgi:hypothetical protein